MYIHYICTHICTISLKLTYNVVYVWLKKRNSFPSETGGEALSSPVGTLVLIPSPKE